MRDATTTCSKIKRCLRKILLLSEKISSYTCSKIKRCLRKILAATRRKVREFKGLSLEIMKE